MLLLEAVLLKLKEAGLKAKVTKCEFLKAKISFLGHMVDEHGIHTMGNKIMVVKNFPQPQDVEKVHSFIALCDYYRCFVKNFAALASPLTHNEEGRTIPPECCSSKKALKP